MNYTYLSLHKHLFAYLFITIFTVIAVTTSLGQLKPAVEYDYLDALGEGGICIVTLVWIFFTLASRPSGRVTNLLFTGLVFTHVSMLLDFLDEFLRYEKSGAWLSAIESLPAPVGMILMTFALYHWHKEQNCINNQLRRTERFYREHHLTDITTGLYGADYIKTQIQFELDNNPNNTPFCLLMLDIQQFSVFNQAYGSAHGDTLLREIGQIIQMNIRDGDVTCRYASDRFVVLLPNTKERIANDISRQIQQAIEHLAYKYDQSSHAIYPQISACCRQYQSGNHCNEVLADINAQLAIVKMTRGAEKTPSQ